MFIQSLQSEVNQNKLEIILLKQKIQELTNLEQWIQVCEQNISTTLNLHQNYNIENYLDNFISASLLITKFQFRKWFTNIIIKIEDFTIEVSALIDSAADVNCIRPRSNSYQISHQNIGIHGLGQWPKSCSPIHTLKSHMPCICKNKECNQESFIVIKHLHYDLILGTPFLIKLQPFLVTYNEWQTKINGKHILFKFTQKPKKEYLKIQLMQSPYLKIFQPPKNFFKSIFPKTSKYISTSSWHIPHNPFCRRSVTMNNEGMGNALPSLPKGSPKNT